MSKKTFIIIITIFSTIALSLFAVAYFISQKSGGEVTTTEALVDFLPFGGVPEKPSTITDFILGGSENGDDGEIIITGPEIVLPKLRKISTTEVSGAAILGLGSSTTIRYTEKVSGHVYETNIERGNLKRISNTTIPKTQEVIFANNGQETINRYLRDDGVTIESFSMKIPQNVEDEQDTESTFLPENIGQLITSPDYEKIFYIRTSSSGSIGTISNPDGSRKNQILESPFNEWLAFWPNLKEIILTTKASSRIPGFAYSLNINNSTFTKILGNINGLTTLMSPDGKFILYNSSDNRNISLYLYNLDNKNHEKIALDTLPEKCVWGVNSENIYCGIPSIVSLGEYPDEWYQGLTSFSDDIWKINTQTGFIDLLSIPEDVEIDGIDLINPILSEDNKYLIFTNKKDDYLWLLNLNSI